jgi:hypothetical protein
MPVLFKNVNATEILAKGAILRVAFGVANSYMDASLGKGFASDFNNLWPKLFNVGGLAYPIGTNPTLKGDTVAVVDLKLSTNTTASALLRALDGIEGFWIEVTSVEKLSGSQAVAAPSNAGAAQREAAKTEEYKQQESESLFNKMAKAANLTLTTVKWVSIAVVLVLLVYFGRDFLLKGKRSK